MTHLVLTDSAPPSEHLLALLGTPGGAPAVRSLLAELQLAPNLSGPWSVAVAAPAHGIDLRFRWSHELAEALHLGAAQEQVLACVFFHAQGHEGHQEYAPALPFGLEFGDSRARARQKLGAPFWSGTRHVSDRWNFPDRYLCLDFSADEASIQLVTVGLPWRARA